MLHRATLVPLIVVLLAVTVPAGALDPFAPRPKGYRDAARNLAVPAGMELYGGLGTWIDMYDEDPWADPEYVVLDSVARGVTTIYLETSNYHKKSALYKPVKIGRFIDAAHASDIGVVAWYVPGFKNLHRDKRRIRAALNFESESGEKFDSFALDIEATVVNKISRRNARMVELTDWLRNKVGADYVMGGIVPDAQSSYWDDFPYAAVAERFDVMMPMSYFTYRVEGRVAVRRYVAANFDIIRSAIGDETFPMHVIGGIGGKATRRETRAYVNAVISRSGLGGSFYDYPITSEAEWEELAALAG